MIANLQPAFHIEIGVKAQELIRPEQPGGMKPHPSYFEFSIPSSQLKIESFQTTLTVLLSAWLTFRPGVLR
jgi:hypothetical protein